MVPVKARALDAAIDLLGTSGLRALTHARIDEHGSLPKGSTSNYFRTRPALLAGVAEEIVRRDVTTVSDGLKLETPDDLIDILCGLLAHNTGPGRTLTTARLILFLEASHDPSLRAILDQGRAAMASIAIVALATLGAPSPHAAATALMSCVEGLTLHRITSHDTTDARPAIELVVHAVLKPQIS